MANRVIPASRMFAIIIVVPRCSMECMLYVRLRFPTALLVLVQGATTGQDKTGCPPLAPNRLTQSSLVRRQRVTAPVHRLQHRTLR